MTSSSSAAADPAIEVAAPPVQEYPLIKKPDLAPSQTPAATDQAVERKSRSVIQIVDFEAECEELVKNMKDAWDDSTARDVRALVRMLRDVVVEHGVTHSGQIDKFHLGALRKHFNDVPKRWGRSARMRAMSTPELRAEGQKLREQPETEGKVAEVGLSAATIRKHFGNLNHFLNHVRGHGYELDELPFEGLKPKKPKLGDIRCQQHKPSPEAVKPIFSSPIYTGSLNSRRGGGTKRPHVFHDATYYLPILLT